MDSKEIRRHFVESIYETLEDVVSPTPYLGITTGDNVRAELLNGMGVMPNPTTREVTVLDMVIAALFFEDFHLLFEGPTGVGKTWTTDGVYKALFGEKGYYTIRLSSEVMGASALEPFTSVISNLGFPTTIVDHGKCEAYGAIFLDEINRGDTQTTFQVIDGEVRVNGDTGYLRLPIKGTQRYRKMVTMAAMNPPDAEHSSATTMDLAGENRFVKISFPNGVQEAGSSQLSKSRPQDLYKIFWDKFKERTGLSGEWKELFPVVADPDQLDSGLSSEVREFIDVTLGYVGYDPVETVKRNTKLMKDAGVSSNLNIRNDNELEKIVEAQKTLRHGFVRRDLEKIEDLAKLLAMVRGFKDGSYDCKITIDDVAVAIGIVLEGKAVTGTEPGHLIALVNDARTAYMPIKSKIIKDPTKLYGIGHRHVTWQTALAAGKKDGIAAFYENLDKGIDYCNSADRQAATCAIRSRLAADLCVLKKFCQLHEDELKEVLIDNNPLGAFIAMYDKHKGESSIYEHRLDSILR